MENKFFAEPWGQQSGSQKCPDDAAGDISMSPKAGVLLAADPLPIGPIAALAADGKISATSRLSETPPAGQSGVKTEFGNRSVNGGASLRLCRNDKNTVFARAEGPKQSLSSSEIASSLTSVSSSQ
jgi:hypothetical protein